MDIPDTTTTGIFIFFKLKESKIEESLSKNDPKKLFLQDEKDYIWDCFTTSFEDIIDTSKVFKENLFTHGESNNVSGYIPIHILKFDPKGNQEFFDKYRLEFKPRVEQEGYVVLLEPDLSYNRRTDVTIEIKRKEIRPIQWR
jgi:hypothetical protein